MKPENTPSESFISEHQIHLIKVTEVQKEIPSLKESYISQLWSTCLWNSRTERAHHLLLAALHMDTAAIMPSMTQSVWRCCWTTQSQPKVVNGATFLSYPLPLKTCPVQGKGSKEQNL